MSNPALLPAGRKLATWVRAGGRPERASRAFLWLYRWRAFWLERSYGLLLTAGPAARASAFPQGDGLIFLQGFWRSGTTLFHELLAEIPGCEVPHTWQCMDPSAMLIPNGKPGTSAAVQRPMDRVMITVDSPQEDEFALMAMGVPSVYQGFLDPRRLLELHTLLRPSFWLEPNTDWIEKLEAFLAWCQQPGQKWMAVKSPNHVFRAPALAAYFPQARFAWILRDPTETWRSNLKMWRTMIDRYGLWTAPERTPEDFLEAALTAYAELLETMYTQGAFRDQPAFSYESLVRDPVAVLPAVVNRLGLGPWEDLEVGLRTRMLAMPKPLVSQNAPISGAPVALLARLQRIQEAILQQK